MKIYLAGALFTAADRAHNILLANELKSLGYEVFVPQESGSDKKHLSVQDIYNENIINLTKADVVLANLDGLNGVDDGTAYEIGYAFGHWSTGMNETQIVVGYVTDFRMVHKVENIINLMFIEVELVRFSAKRITNIHGITEFYRDLAQAINLTIERKTNA